MVVVGGGVGGGGGGGQRNSEKVILLKEKERHMVQSYSRNRWDFRGLLDAAKESASLIVCGRAFQSLGAELGKALKPKFLLVFFSTVLRIRRRGCDDERKGSCRDMSGNEFLQVFRRRTVVVFVHQGHDFVINSLSHWKPVQFFQDKRNVYIYTALERIVSQIRPVSVFQNRETLVL